MTPNSENKRVWFITGASKGLGYAFTCAALKAGDKVVAVARTIDNLAKLKETYPETLLPLSLDVTDREAVFSTVETAVKHFGRLDIVVNNAGIMTLGMIEELNESDARKLMDTNFFSEAAVFFLRNNERAQKMHQKLVSKFGKGKALSLIAQKLGRTVYYMLKHNTAFEPDKFFQDGIAEPLA